MRILFLFYEKVVNGTFLSNGKMRSLLPSYSLQQCWHTQSHISDCSHYSAHIYIFLRYSSTRSKTFWLGMRKCCTNYGNIFWRHCTDLQSIVSGMRIFLFKQKFMFFCLPNLAISFIFSLCWGNLAISLFFNEIHSHDCRIVGKLIWFCCLVGRTSRMHTC